MALNVKQVALVNPGAIFQIMRPVRIDGQDYKAGERLAKDSAVRNDLHKLASLMRTRYIAMVGAPTIGPEMPASLAAKAKS